MNKKTKIFSDFSKIATDALGTISGIKKEIETIVKINIEKIIKKTDLVKREEFVVLKSMIQKISKQNKDLEKEIIALKKKIKIKKKISKKPSKN